MERFPLDQNKAVAGMRLSLLSAWNSGEIAGNMFPSPTAAWQMKLHFKCKFKCNIIHYICIFTKNIRDCQVTIKTFIMWAWKRRRELHVFT